MATTYDLNLGSLDIIGIGTLASGTGELRSGAGIVFNGGNDNSRNGAGGRRAGDQTASNDVRLNGAVRLDGTCVLDTDRDDADDLARPSTDGGGDPVHERRVRGFAGR